MKKKWCCFPSLNMIFYGMFLLIPSSSYSVTWNSMRLNTVRIAYFVDAGRFGDGHLDDFMVRAKKARYNYVTGDFRLSPGEDSTYAKLKNQVKKSFARTDSFGLRLIPTIVIGSAYSTHWEIARKWNPHIQMLRVHLSVGGDTAASYGGPSFSYDPLGIDKTFLEVLRAVREAYESARVSYPLEFIHLSHDEPASYTYLLMGGCKTGRDSSRYCSTMMPFEVDTVYEDCQLDKDYIMKYSGTKSAAVQSLLVTELFRRLNQIQSVFGNRVRLMANADLWDVSVQRQTFYLWNGDSVNFSSGLASLPGLTNDTDKRKFKNNVLLMPWNYDRCAGANGREYSAAAAFSHLASNGFKFVYWHAAGALHRKIDMPLVMELHAASLKFKSNCLGYIGASWNDYPHHTFDSMDTVYSVNASHLPLKDFKWKLW